MRQHQMFYVEEDSRLILLAIVLIEVNDLGISIGARNYFKESQQCQQDF
jgi:hypothetical protein